MLETISIRHKNAARFIGYLAQWVDIGFASPSRLRNILSRFHQSLRPKLSVADYLYLRMAEGMVAMAEQSSDVAIRHFDLLTMLVSAGQKERVDTQHALPPRDGVARNRRVRRPNVRTRIDVVDGRGEVKAG